MLHNYNCGNGYVMFLLSLMWLRFWVGHQSSEMALTILVVLLGLVWLAQCVLSVVLSYPGSARATL